MIEDVAGVFKSLKDKDFRVLVGIEAGMKFHEWIPLEEIPKLTKLQRDEIQFRLSRLAKNKLIQRIKEPYEGYKIYFEGYDLLALNTFVKRNTVQAIGEKIGIGKESIIYEAIGGLALQPVIIKFHREGITSFKHVRISRGHLEDRRHFSWLYAARLAAKREYEALKILYPKVAVPEPIDHNRHALVMSIIQGKDLAHTKLDEPSWFLDRIIEQITKTYSTGIIHGDLSEYNIFVNPEGIEIIDWPQYITKKHPNSEEILRRDIGNVLAFFKRKYDLKQDIEKVIRDIKL